MPHDVSSDLVVPDLVIQNTHKNELQLTALKCFAKCIRAGELWFLLPVAARGPAVRFSEVVC